MNQDRKSNKLKPRRARDTAGWMGHHRGPRSLWLNPGGVGREGPRLQSWQVAGAQKAGLSTPLRTSANSSGLKL